MPLFVQPKEECAVVQDVPQPSTAAVYNESSTITSIEGTEWNTVYYSQVLNDSDAPRQLDFGLSPSIQQYYRITNFTLFVTEPLAHETDSNVITELTGRATLWPSIAPNVGDHFVAKMDDGRWAVFVVTNLTRLGYYAQSTYTISYSFFSYYTDEYVDEFNEKTIADKVFDGTGVTDAGSATTLDASMMLKQLLDVFYDDFFDNLSRTALYPDSTSRVYDPGTARFFAAIVGKDMRQQRPRLQVYETPTDGANKRYTTVWDVIADGNTFGLVRAAKQHSIVSSGAFGSTNVGYSIATSPITRVLYPNNVNGLRFSATNDASDDYYVFTKAFYENDTINMTKLEVMVRERLECNKIDIERIREQAEHVMLQDDQRRFWHIPVLIWLLIGYLNEK